MYNMEQQTHLTPAQLAERIQIEVRTLEAWRYRRVGPPFVRVGRTVRYPINELEKWLEAQKP